MVIQLWHIIIAPVVVLIVKRSGFVADTGENLDVPRSVRQFGFLLAGLAVRLMKNSGY